MTNVIDEIVQVAQELIPGAPIVEAAAQVAETIAHPTIENIVADLQLAQNLIGQLKGFHPSVINIVKALL